ncbi:unnamed protein product [Dovyalis caffra]|uniref:Uncharacterized protein n=1 Tax=Dovyalis caffra TaxID=77055 RepID=A0AAV1RV93_9ROSI|nr:unnamed protein product [Dovyalis caffra]
MGLWSKTKAVKELNFGDPQPSISHNQTSTYRQSPKAFFTSTRYTPANTNISFGFKELCLESWELTLAKHYPRALLSATDSDNLGWFGKKMWAFLDKIREEEEIFRVAFENELKLDLERQGVLEKSVASSIVLAYLMVAFVRWSILFVFGLEETKCVGSVRSHVDM